MYEEFEESNRWLNNVPVLKTRMKDKGYLFFRGILDKDALLQIRLDILELAAKYDLVREDTELIEGNFTENNVPASFIFERSPLYREILNMASFNAFGNMPLMNLLFSGLLEGEVQEHRRRIARLTFPQSFSDTTPPHQDFYYIRGTQETYTSWIPCGDCPRQLGGLAVLEASNHLGFLPHVPMSGTGGHGISEEMYESKGLRWLTTDFKLGDLLMFHSHTLHKALDNVDSDKMRVSLEYRYQRKEEKIDPSSLEYHMKGHI